MSRNAPPLADQFFKEPSPPLLLVLKYTNFRSPLSGVQKFSEPPPSISSFPLVILNELSLNSFHWALKKYLENFRYLAFLDIKVSIEGNGLCTSVYFKPTASHLFVVFIFIITQFLRLSRLCSEDSDAPPGGGGT